MEEMEKFETTETAEIDNEKKKISTKIITTVAILIVIIAAGALAFNPIKTAIQKNKMYKEVLALIESESYSEAINPLKELGDYKNCKELYATAFEGVREEVKKYDGIINAGIAVIGKKADGTVIAAGHPGNDRCNVYSWENIKFVDSGDGTVGVKNDGTAVSAGKTGWWTKIDMFDLSAWRDIVEVSVSRNDHVLGLKKDGAVVADGVNDSGQCNVSEWYDIVSVSAGYDFSVAAKSDGTVVAIGNNDCGQINVSSWTDIIEVAAGEDHTIGLKKDGTVVSTGNSEYNKCDVYDWSDIVSVSAGMWVTVGLKADGTVVSTGYDTSSWKDVVAVSAGQEAIIGLKKDGTVYVVENGFDGAETIRQWDLF